MFVSKTAVSGLGIDGIGYVNKALSIPVGEVSVVGVMQSQKRSVREIIWRTVPRHVRPMGHVFSH